MFPEAPRVIYRKKPSEEVICQLRFPAILRIDAEPPASFQERIREQYPNFRENPSSGFSTMGIPADFARFFEAEFPFTSGKTYEFASPDRSWMVHLDRDSLAVTTRAYERWEGFKEHLHYPFKALCEIYRPTFFARIGLRYKDVIRRSKLGLEGIPWSELLNPYIAAEFGAAVI